MRKTLLSATALVALALSANAIFAQRVFLGWAQVWREKIRDETLRQRLVSDPRSPARYRVNGVIRNVDAWYSAFQVRPGDSLYVAPTDRVKIW